VTLTVFLLTLAVMVLFSVLWVGFGRVREVSTRGGLDGDLSAEARWATLDDLARKKTMLQQELKEIDLDFEMGKIDQADFNRSKRRFERMWLAIDDQLQAAIGESAAHRARIDAELSLRLDSPHPSASPSAPSRRVCARCGSTWTTRDGTCQSCGEELVTA
jgi:hypothetical protein